MNALGFYDSWSWFQQFANIPLGGDHPPGMHPVFLGLVPLTHFFRARMRRANCTNATAAQSSKQLECSGYQQQAAAKEVPKCPHKLLRRVVKTEKGTGGYSMEFVCIQLNVFYPQSMHIFRSR